MAIIYSDNFDGESEGTSPPANWVDDGGFPANNFEVDDAQYYSSPHSAWLKKLGSGTGWCHHDEAAGFDTDRISFRRHFTSTDRQHHIITNKATGDHIATNIAAHIQLRNDGSIWWYDGSYHDTGYTYSTGWHLWEIVHDCASDTFDLWYDSVQIINNGGFRNTATSIKSLHQQVDATYGTVETWFDDVQIGAAGWEGVFNGVTNPAKINGVDKASILKVNGVVST